MTEKQIEELVTAKVQSEMAKFRRRRILILALGIILVPLTIWATTITKPYTFTSGTPAVASQVNDNFDVLYSKINELIGKQSPFRQIQSITKTDVFNTMSSAFTDVTGLSVTITPKGTNSKFLVLVNLNCGMSNGSAGHYRIVRDSVSVADGLAAGANRKIGTGGNCFSSDINHAQSMGMNFLDAPAGGGPFTYKIQVSTADGSGVLRVNTSGSDADATYTMRYVSTLTVIEIDGTEA